MITNKMISSLSKKLIIAFGIVAIVFNLSAPAVLAQTPEQGQWYTPTYGDFNTKVTANPQEEIFGERYTQAQVYWIMYSLINFLTGSDVGKCITSSFGLAGSSTDSIGAQQGADLATCLQGAGVPIPGSTSYIPGKSPVLDLAYAVDVTRTTMPADGIQYIAQKVDNIVPTAYAQSGFGFSTLTGTQNLWTASRNMAYGLMVLVVLGLAFAVMFRVKTSPQTSITIQSAIPKVVIALIVVTFSYAIAGLLIDLAFLVQGIIASLVYASGITNLNPVQLLTTMNQSGYGVMSIGLLTIIFGILGGVAIGLGAAAVSTGGVLIAGPLILPVAAGATVVGIVGGIIIFILLILAFVVTLVRVLWLFLKTYATLLINIVFGPFIILFGAVNIGGGVMGWLKSMASQLSVFVTASVLILVAHVFIWGSGAFPWLSGSGAAQPVHDLLRAFNAFDIKSGQASLGSANVPGLTGANESLLGFFVGLAVLFAIPNLASFVRDQISKPARLELGIGAAFGLSRTLANLGIGQYTEGVNRGTLGAEIVAQQARVDAAKGTAAYAGELRRLTQLQQRAKMLQNIGRGRL